MDYYRSLYEEGRAIKKSLLERIFRTNTLREELGRKTNSASSVQEKSSMLREWYKNTCKQLALTEFYEKSYREPLLNTNTEYLEAEISQIEKLLEKMPSTGMKNSDYVKGLLNFEDD